MRHALCLSLGLVVASCGGYTSEEIRAEPVRFSMTVAAPLDRLATCIKASYIDEYSVVDLPVAAERRTELVLYAGGYPSVANVIFNLQATDQGTVVTWRRQKMVMNQGAKEQEARANVERCGKV